MENDQKAVRDEFKNLIPDPWGNPEIEANLFQKGYASPRNRIVLIGVWILSGVTILSSGFFLFALSHVTFLGDLIIFIPLIALLLFLIFISFTISTRAFKKYKKTKSVH